MLKFGPFLNKHVSIRNSKSVRLRIIILVSTSSLNSIDESRDEISKKSK